MQESRFAVPASFRPVFSAGGTVSRGLRTLLDKPVPFLALAFLSLLPMAALYGALLLQVNLAEFRAMAAGQGVYPGWFWPAYAAATLLSMVPGAASIHAAAEHMQGREVRIGDSLATGFRRVPPFALVNFIFGVLVGLGFLALFVPGIIVMCIFFMAGPVAVMERRGIFGALGRAASLSKGYRTTLFAVGAALFGIYVAVALGFVLYMFLASMIATVAGPIVGGILTIPVTVVLYLGVASLFPILLGASYVGLREEKEGGSSDQVAGVFT